MCNKSVNAHTFSAVCASELLNSLYIHVLHQVCVACSVQMGQNWAARAPVRRALIPAKRGNNSDIHDALSGNVGSGRSSVNDMDDRIHNSLLEELCADFGVTDSSYVDFFNFDIPGDRVHSAQLPADLEELGEIVTFGGTNIKSQSACSGSEGVLRTGNFLRPTVTTVKATSGVQMNIPDDVASPTISSSCEDSKPLDGGGEGLSDFPATVHSTTGCPSAKQDTDTSDIGEVSLKQSLVKSEKVVETKPPSTQVPDEEGSTAVNPSEEQSGKNDSSTSSPRHVAKKARMIESGGDLLEDIKKSYAFVCGADMFSPPTRAPVSHPRLQTAVSSQNRMTEPVPYSQYPPAGSGVRMSYADGYERPFQYGMPNRSIGQRPVSDMGGDTVSSQSANFSNLTPDKGFRQPYGNDWQISPASGHDRSYHTNAMHHPNMIGSGSVDFLPRAAPNMQFRGSSVGTTSDISGSVPYTDGVPYPRTSEFPYHGYQNRLNFPTVNRSPRSAVDQPGRLYGSSVDLYGGSYQPVSRQPGPQPNEFYHNPPASPYRNLPSDVVRHRSVTAHEGENMYPTGCPYPGQNTHPANVITNANYKEQGHCSLPASPVRYRGQSVTPGFVPAYPLKPEVPNFLPDSNSGIIRYPSHDSAAATGRMPPMLDSSVQQAPLAPGVENNGNFNGVSTQNDCSNYSQPGSEQYADRQANFPRSPVTDRRAINQMTPRGVPVPLYTEQPFTSRTLPAGRPPGENGCHGFVRHLIGSGSGPYRSHPLFPLLRDLVIADMNFEAPSFPYPLITGLPKSFERLISNYFSCTTHAVNKAHVDSSVDSIVMDALRYAHSALLGTSNIFRFLYILSLLCLTVICSHCSAV